MAKDNNEVNIIEKEEKLEYYFGLLGAFMPFILFGITVVFLVFKGMITMTAYLGPMVVAVALAVVLSKDKKRACDAMIDGLTQRTLAVIILAFIGAGVLGSLMTQSGAVQGIVYVGYKTGATGTVFLLITFAVCSLIATATGTSTGTCVTAVPVLYPAGVLLGVHPALLLGAIYSGARFGDNIAPISDTTIASTTTQGATIKEVVTMRLKYAFAAMGASILIYVILNSILGGTQGAAAELDSAIDGYGENLSALFMLLAPATTIVFCLRGKPLIQALWYGILVGSIIGLVSGTLTIGSLYYIEAPKTVGGVLTKGVTKMSDVVLLNIFIMVLLEPLKEAGALESISKAISKFATTRKRAELTCFTLVSVMYPVTGVNTPAILFTGPIVKEIGERFDIAPARRANLIDLASNGVTGNLPHINTILALAAGMISVSETVAGVPIVPITTIGLFSFHPMMLTLVALISIYTGWGSKKG